MKHKGPHKYGGKMREPHASGNDDFKNEKSRKQILVVSFEKEEKTCYMLNSATLGQ
jgi:hypothetical protein